MESEVAVRLAADILRDHFGNVVERVAVVLFHRGALSFHDIMRFVNEESVPTEVEELSFVQVRNALLTMVQHGAVTAGSRSPADGVANSDSARSLLQVYRIDIEEVLARLRFPHFLEHVSFMYSETAGEIVTWVLRYGRAACSHLISDVSRVLETTPSEIEDELQVLVESGILRAVEACEISESQAPNKPIPSAGGAEPPQQRKRCLEDHSQQQTVALDKSNAHDIVKGRDKVYCHDHRVLNLCLCKDLLSRYAEEHYDSHAAKVLSVLLTVVTLANATKALGANREMRVDWLEPSEIETKMCGFHQGGRDPVREREMMFKALNHLCAFDGLVKKREQRVVRNSRADDLPAIGGGSISGGASGSRGAKIARTRAPEPVQHPAEKVWVYAVDLAAARRVLKSAASANIIRDHFGTAGLRMFNLLKKRDPPQKLEDMHIFQTCMVDREEGRKVLNDMVRSQIINWQEVPKTQNPPLANSYWLYYVDLNRANAAILQNVLQAILNLRVRFRTESAKAAPLVEAPMEKLTEKERRLRNAGIRDTDILERSFLVLNAAILAHTWL